MTIYFSADGDQLAFSSFSVPEVSALNNFTISLELEKKWS
jgi:hypothetical protein